LGGPCGGAWLHPQGQKYPKVMLSFYPKKMIVDPYNQTKDATHANFIYI
jgi:hypothetical protein